MKRPIALMICAVSLGAAAQFPNLPYNPDENGDGFVGVADLQGLLAVYGQTLENLTVSNDSAQAVVFVGDLSSPHCMKACSDLPGNWRVMTLFDAGLIWTDLVTEAMSSAYYSFNVWIGSEDEPDNLRSVLTRQDNSYETGIVIGTSASATGAGFSPARTNDCYCATREFPKVEYFTCTASCNDGIEALDNCVNSKTQEGWYPMNQSQTQIYNICYWQPMWRWAE